MHTYRRILGLLAALLLLMSLGTFAAGAADPEAMTDISGHWAREDILYCLEQKLYSGVSETVFAPEGTMTRGMFVTVLGRLADVDPEDYAGGPLGSMFEDVDPWAYYAPYVNWAARAGVVNGMSETEFAPGAYITREQMAAMVVRFADVYNYDILGQPDAEAFDDAGSISRYAREAVEVMRQTGLLKGFSENGGLVFKPRDNTTRAQCAAVFHRLSLALSPRVDPEAAPPAQVELSQESLELQVGEEAALTAAVLPETANNQELIWISTRDGVAAVEDGTVTALAPGKTVICAIAWNGVSGQCAVTVSDPQAQDPEDDPEEEPAEEEPAEEEPAEEEPTGEDLAYEGESYDSKCVRIFGKVVDDPRTYYQGSPDSYLTEIKVRCWDFVSGDSGEKETVTHYIRVHKNIASTVAAIFEEIYRGKEKFPISSLGGYYDGGKSEHTPGLAIDINPSSNYYCDPQGNAIVGRHWDPENDPYSIPPEGDVVKAFRKYGFTQGIYWRSGYKDYMHFSFFGT